MNEPNSATSNRAIGTKPSRRRVLTVGASTAAVLLAGCSGSTGDGGGDGTAGGGADGTGSDGGDDTPASADGTTTASGTFRLLISDRPADIGDFDRLDVSFDRARIFRAASGDDEDDSQSASTTTTENATDTATATETVTANATTTRNETDTTTTTETTTANATATESPDEAVEEDGQAGFSLVDLDGATVDLTQVVGEKAVSAFDGELPAGRYAKVELYVDDVEGIVDGDQVEVKVPSGKLKLVKPFEVVEGQELSFVFDINVVKKGQGGYNLLPVISESGVVGEDVNVEEVGDESGGSDAEAEAEAETETETGTETETETETET